MDYRLTYNGTVSTDGKLTIHRKKELIREVGSAFPGKQVTITIQKKKRNRSVFQNAYYWGVVIPLVQQGLIDTGWRVDKESTHEFLKTKFNIKELINEDSGEIKTYIGSTTRMTTSEMMDYFAEITQWAAEDLGVQIPEPGEQTNIEFNN